jgi:hypothetical protein
VEQPPAQLRAYGDCVGCIWILLMVPPANAMFAWLTGCPSGKVTTAVWSGLARADVSAEPQPSARPYREMAMPPTPGPPVSLAEMRAN